MANSDSQLNQIDHIVVLMLENRSFDNILGWLYDPGNKAPFDHVPPGQKFDGLSGKPHCNPRPGGGEACVGKGKVMTDPYPDPNEPYDHVFTQMYNKTYPKEKIPNTTETPSMDGFVIDYAEAISKAGKPKNLSGILKSNAPFDTDPGIIMNCFTPDRLPVINGLANAYAVCDHWFSSVPTQTFPNRSFVHAATSSGYVYNTWKTGDHFWDIGVFINKTPTIFNLLEKRGVSWRIYYGGPLLLCNALITQDKLWGYLLFGDRFRPFNKFQDDLNKGLPSYTFIEPNFMCSQKYGPENDMHPAFGAFDTGNPTNVLYGDSLVYEVYQALLKSPNWDRTLLVITFDEHGGCYDHVPTPPPLATRPDHKVVPPSEPGGSGFIFNRYGVRVPTVLVSPLIKQGTVCNTVLDHTSIIKTVARRWLGNDLHLTQRDKDATDLSEVLTLPKADDDRPIITPSPVPLFTDCGGQLLSDFHRDMVAAAAQRMAHKRGELMDLSHMQTTEQAVAALDAQEGRLRG